MRTEQCSSSVWSRTAAPPLYIADTGNARVREIADDVITTVAGTGTSGSTVIGTETTITFWTAGATRPYVATINDPQDKNVANAAIVPAGSSSGGVSVYNAGPSVTDVVIDMNGYFAPATGVAARRSPAQLRPAERSGPHSPIRSLRPTLRPAIAPRVCQAVCRLTPPPD